MDYIKLVEELREQNKNIPELRPGTLNEAGLSRLITKVSDTNGNIIVDFGVLTAFRGENDLNTNRKRNNELIRGLNQNKLGPYFLSGHWTETIDGKPVNVEEDSLLVVKPQEMDRNTFIDYITSLGKKYQQQAVLIGLNGEGIFSYDEIGSNKIGTKLVLGKLADAYSQMKKKPIPFIFEGIQKPYGFSSYYGFKGAGIKYE